MTGIDIACVQIMWAALVVLLILAAAGILAGLAFAAVLAIRQTGTAQAPQRGPVPACDAHHAEHAE